MVVHVSPPAATTPVEWHGSRSARFLAVLLLCAIAASWRLTEVRPLAFLQTESLHQVWLFVQGMLPPAYSLAFFKATCKPLLETLQIAFLGTSLAVLLGFPLALLATSNVFFAGPLHEMQRRNPPTWLVARLPYTVARLLLNLLRAIPELVWALVFVRALGLGAATGVVALAVNYSGMLGKVYADILEAVPSAPLEALQSTGASRWHILLYGWLPQAWPNIVGYTLYRWECAVRASALMGFVGAGGIGQSIELSMRMFEYQEAVSLILLIVALSAVVEYLGDRVRQRVH